MNENLTVKGIDIEKRIVSLINKKNEKSLFNDYLIEILFESLEYNQFDDDDLENGIDKDQLKNDIIEGVTDEIINCHFIDYYDYNYNLLLNDCNLNYINISSKIKGIHNKKCTVDYLINIMIYDEINDLLSNLIEILDEIIELYYFTILVVKGMTLCQIYDDCYITEKNIEVIINCITYNYYAEESIYINYDLTLNIDMIDDVHDDALKILNMFNLILVD
jgi:hypothetical protein